VIPLKAVCLNFHVGLFARSSNQNAVCVSVCLSLRIDGWGARVVAEDSTCDNQTPRLLNAHRQDNSGPRSFTELYAGFAIHLITRRLINHKDNSRFVKTTTKSKPGTSFIW
jgi:hypothetical protein